MSRGREKLKGDMTARDGGCRHAVVTLRGTRGDSVMASVLRKGDGGMWVAREACGRGEAAV